MEEYQPRVDLSNQNQEYFTEEPDVVDHNNFTEDDHESTLESDEKRVISREITRVGSKFQCDKLFYDSSTARKHIRSVHEGVKYACNQCDYQATQQCSLKRHIQSKHDGVKYPRNQSKFQCPQSDKLFTERAAVFINISDLYMKE